MLLFSLFKNKVGHTRTCFSTILPVPLKLQYYPLPVLDIDAHSCGANTSGKIVEFLSETEVRGANELHPEWPTILPVRVKLWGAVKNNTIFWASTRIYN